MKAKKPSKFLSSKLKVMSKEDKVPLTRDNEPGQ